MNKLKLILYNCLLRGVVRTSAVQLNTQAMPSLRPDLRHMPQAMFWLVPMERQGNQPEATDLDFTHFKSMLDATGYTINNGAVV